MGRKYRMNGDTRSAHKILLKIDSKKNLANTGIAQMITLKTANFVKNPTCKKTE
jgi:hypothetical protein